MKMKKLIYAAILGLPIALASCENQEQVFPDFDYQTIYFANQSPLQCITLGEDGEFDVTMDNDHRFIIYATVGGVNTNKDNRWVDYVIDNTLVDRVTFDDGSEVKALPSNYYQILSDAKRIYINKGHVIGGIEIQLTDAFFNDPEAVKCTYVVPVRLTEASDSILSGEAKDGIDSPDILNEQDWNVLPKNYTLYGIKFKNKWHGTWLSRGTVETDNNGEKSTTTHQNEYWENEEIHYLTSKGLNSCYYAMTQPVQVTDANGVLAEEILNCNVILNIDDSGNVTCTTDTEGCTVTGSGKYTYHGAGKAWGVLERDLIDLDFTYTIPYVLNYKTGETANVTVHVVEKLVARDRQSKFETFTVVMKP